MRLSLGLRPVFLPEKLMSAPVLEMTAPSLRIACSYSVATGALRLTSAGWAGKGEEKASEGKVGTGSAEEGCRVWCAGGCSKQARSGPREPDSRMRSLEDGRTEAKARRARVSKLGREEGRAAALKSPCEEGDVVDHARLGSCWLLAGTRRERFPGLFPAPEHSRSSDPSTPSNPTAQQARKREEDAHVEAGLREGFELLAEELERRGRVEGQRWLAAVTIT